MTRHVPMAAVAVLSAALVCADLTQEYVRIVDHGQDLLRQWDSKPIHQFHAQRYTTAFDSAQGVWNTVGTYAEDLAYDVDGDGQTNDDLVGFVAFSTNVPFSTDAAWYDTEAASPRFYGGAALFQANARATGYSEFGVNDETVYYQFTPRDNWTLFRESYEIYAPYRAYAVWLWQKDDFLNGGARHAVTFDSNSYFSTYFNRYYMGYEGCRWVAQDGSQYYISEATFKGAGQTRGNGNGKVHTLCPLDTRWALYHPHAPYHIALDTNVAFAAHTFTDVRSVGFYLFKDTFIPAYTGFKWYAFEVNAVVTRPAQPSWTLAMTTITPTNGVPAFHIGATELPYRTWKTVFRRARSNTFSHDPRGYVFDKDGDMGSMDYPTNANGALTPHSLGEPVTDITLHDAAAWCNALSEAESKTPCYYLDPMFTAVYRQVRFSPMYTNTVPRPFPPLYVKWSADGYRLPTIAEWLAACRTSQTCPTGLTRQTHTVGTTVTNEHGLYDALGNVWELTWPGVDVWNPALHTNFTVLGGDFNYPSDPMLTSANPFGDLPFEGSYNIGLRVLRREAGLPSPPFATNVPPGIPAWQMRKDAIAKTPGTPPTPSNTVETVSAGSFAIGKYEVTFGQWKHVRDWAVWNGFTFDADGDIGSMDYWGWTTMWPVVAQTFGPDHPVTDIGAYDAYVWCNALSLLDGCEPVYYTDAALTGMYRTAFPWRALMVLNYEQSRYPLGGNILSIDTNVSMKTTANGYRLPSNAELASAATGGSGARYAWGNAMTAGVYHAWLLESSGGGTHPAGAKLATGVGIYDANGNVSELGAPAHSSGSQAERNGGSFADLTIGQNFSASVSTQPRGMGYPDTGFRVLRQGAGKAQSTKDVDSRRHKTSSVTTAPLVLTNYDPLNGRVFRGNLARTGAHEAPGLRTLTGLKWRFKTGGPVKSSPVVVDGIVYVGSLDSNIYALIAASGSQVWRHAALGRVWGSAAVAYGKVYMADESGWLWALDALSGACAWSNRITATGRPAGSPAVAYGTVFMPRGNAGGGEVVGMSSESMVGLCAFAGTTTWTTTAAAPQGYSAPCLDGTSMYASTTDNPVALGLADGAQRWRNTTSERLFSGAAFLGNRVYYVTSVNGGVRCFDSTSGTRLWEQYALTNQVSVYNEGEAGYEIFTAPAVANGRVYIGCNDGRLHTFDMLTGARGWTYATGGKVQSSPAVAGGVVYVGSWDGGLYALDASTGAFLWKYQTGDRIISSPWPVDTMVLVGSDDGYLYALEGIPEPQGLIAVGAAGAALIRACAARQ